MALNLSWGVRTGSDQIHFRARTDGRASERTSNMGGGFLTLLSPRRLFSLTTALILGGLAVGSFGQSLRLQFDGNAAPRVLMSVTAYRLTGVPILKELEAWVFGGASVKDGYFTGGVGLVKPFRVADQIEGFAGFGLEFSQAARPKGSILLGMGWKF